VTPLDGTFPLAQAVRIAARVADHLELDVPSTQECFLHVDGGTVEGLDGLVLGRCEASVISSSLLTTACPPPPPPEL